jgi:membrane fusion protein (multidrug efflux system)
MNSQETQTISPDISAPAGQSQVPTGQPPKPPAQQQGSGKRPLRILTFLVIAAAIAAGGYHLLTRNYEGTDDAFIEGHIIQVSPKISAYVVAVHFDDNTEVKKDDLLLELDPRDVEVALQRAEAQRLQAQAQREQAHQQAAQAVAQAAQTQAQVAQAQAQALQQTAQFDVSQINFQRNQSLFQKDLRAVAKEQVDTTKAAFDSAKGAYDAANANVKAVRSAATAAEAQAAGAQAQAAAADAAVKVAEAAVDDAKLQLSYTKIRAAADGRMTRKSVEPGDYVQPAQTLASIVQHDVWVTANYKETQLNRMRVGQHVTVKVDAYPERTLTAHVDSFQLGTGAHFSLLPPENATGNYVKVVQRVPVKIVFDEPQDVLRRLGPGMSVEPEVNVGVEPRK